MAKRSDRLEVRLSPAQRAEIERAAGRLADAVRQARRSARITAT